MSSPLFLAEFGVMTRAEAIEVVESRMRKIHEMMEAKDVEIVVETLEDTI